jgi:hypothetical protein
MPIRVSVDRNCIIILFVRLRCCRGIDDCEWEHIQHNGTADAS